MSWLTDKQRKQVRDTEGARMKEAQIKLFTTFWGRKYDGQDLALAHGADTARKFSLLTQKDNDDE